MLQTGLRHKISNGLFQVSLQNAQSKYYFMKQWRVSSIFYIHDLVHTKVSFFVQCTKMQLISFQNFKIQTCFSQFLWFFSLKCWFKGQIISRIHLGLSNAFKLMCFDRNINENRDVKFLECDYLLVQRCVKLTLIFVS